MGGLVTDRSYWLDQALTAEPGWQTASPQLDGRVRADVCIVGGGFTGLWTAVELLSRDASLRIAIIEAGVCGAGASGANAGYLMNLWPKFGSLIAVAGREDGAHIARQSAEAVTEIVEFISRERIDAQLVRGGWVWGSTNTAQDDSWDPLMSELADVPGSPLRELDPNEAAAITGSPMRGGVLDPTCAVLQPALLARGLRQWLIAAGVQIFEGTRMTRIRSGSRIRVGTPAGEVESDAVVLAVNAWAMAFPQVRRHMLITASDTVVVPAPQDAAEGLADGVGVSDSGRLLNYWRRIPEGHLLFGKGGLAVGYGAGAADRLFRHRVDETSLRDRMGRLLPGIPYRPLFRWRAPVEYSLTSLPFFTQLDGHPQVYVAAGYSGDGVGPSKLGAKILASLALGSRDEWSASPLTRAPTQTLPPEPLRFVGGLIVGRALRRQDQRQAAGRPTDKPTELLTRLDPTSWVS